MPRHLRSTESRVNWRLSGRRVPDSLKARKGSATRKSEPEKDSAGYSALTYWSGIIKPCAFVERKLQRVRHPPKGRSQRRHAGLAFDDEQAKNLKTLLRVRHSRNDQRAGP